eukprot:6475066-Amphidinium_carterae.3
MEDTKSIDACVAASKSFLDSTKTWLIASLAAEIAAAHAMLERVSKAEILLEPSDSFTSWLSGVAKQCEYFLDNTLLLGGKPVKEKTETSEEAPSATDEPTGESMLRAHVARLDKQGGPKELKDLRWLSSFRHLLDEQSTEWYSKWRTQLLKATTSTATSTSTSSSSAKASVAAPATKKAKKKNVETDEALHAAALAMLRLTPKTT